MEIARTQAKDKTSYDITSSDSPDITMATSEDSEALCQSMSANIADDPTIFELAKRKKITLMEGIKKFNFEPERVIDSSSFMITISHYTN